MALVHDTIFSRGDIAGLDFGQYAHDLIDEISVSMKLDEEDVIAVKSDDIELPLGQAIPAGLILNELLTNSCKHARTPGKALRIEIEIVSSDKKCCIRLKDNGPGMNEQDTQKSNSMGMDLISALCDQIGGKSRWWNDDGYNFELVIG
jgi:two-component sensor histidine kinase